MGERQRCEEHEKVSSWVSLQLDGRLSCDRQAELESHLAACPRCQGAASAMRRASSMMVSLPMVGPSFGFTLRVQTRLAEQNTKRRQVLRGVALLTSSVSLVGVGVAAILVLGLGLAAMLWLGSQPSGLEAGRSMTQVVSGLGLMGKGASMFLKEILLRYGLPVVLVVGTGLAVMGGVWAWLLSRKSNGSRRNGYAS